MKNIFQIILIIVMIIEGSSLFFRLARLVNDSWNVRAMVNYDLVDIITLGLYLFVAFPILLTASYKITQKLLN